MASAHFVKKAMKDYPSDGIKKGEPYWWWAFRYGGKRRSKTPPRASQLTQSEFWGRVHSASEAIEDEIKRVREDHAKWREEKPDVAKALDAHIAEFHLDASGCDKDCAARPIRPEDEFDWSAYASIEDAMDEIRDAGEDASSSRDSMPDGLQDGETGEMLQGRADAAQECADELDNVKDQWEEANDDLEKRIEAMEEAMTAIGNISCD